MRRFAVAALVLLAGCSSTNKGGYYKDDGPGARSPGSLSSIPDARPRAEPLNKFANKPYEVFGKKYVPANCGSWLEWSVCDGPM
jgi:rare lipoprotein A